MVRGLHLGGRDALNAACSRALEMEMMLEDHRCMCCDDSNGKVIPSDMSTSGELKRCCHCMHKPWGQGQEAAFHRRRADGPRQEDVIPALRGTIPEIKMISPY